MPALSESPHDFDFTGYAAAKARKYGRKQLFKGMKKKISQ